MTTSSSPTITALRVIPVAGRDSMLLNLSGAHAPYFTRNLVILTDSRGATGIGEVPGGPAIRQTLEDAAELVIGQSIGNYRALLRRVRETFASRDAGGRGTQTSPSSTSSGRNGTSRGTGSARAVVESRPHVTVAAARSQAVREDRSGVMSACLLVIRRRC